MPIGGNDAFLFGTTDLARAGLATVEPADAAGTTNGGTATAADGGDRITHTAATHPTLSVALDRFGPGADPVAGMSLREKVDASARAGIASAAKTAGGATAAFLKDPKNDAMLAGGTALVAGAQFVPGVDVGVDATLGAAGAAMYAAAGPEHRDNVTKALGKLKDYTSEVGNAKSQADLDKASKDFAAFLTIGGKEAADAIGVVGGAASAPTKFFGLAKKAQELGGIDGVMAAGSRGVRALDDAASSAAKAVRNGLDAGGEWLESAGRSAGIGRDPAVALPGGGTLRSSQVSSNPTILESRAQNPTGSVRRTLRDHEVAGGHTIEKHVGISNGELQDRLTEDPKLKAVSTFTNEAAANRTQAAFVKRYQPQINAWLANPKAKPSFEAKFDTGRTTGRVLERGKATPSETTSAVCVIVRDDSKPGWHFLTSYPVK